MKTIPFYDHLAAEKITKDAQLILDKLKDLHGFHFNKEPDELLLELKDLDCQLYREVSKTYIRETKP